VISQQVFTRVYNVKKRVYLFGCSIRIPGTREGCGEPRMYLDYDKINSTIAESRELE